MDQQNYHCSITANVSAQDAFDSVCRVSDWWGRDIEGPTKNDGDIFTIHFATTFVTFKITEAISGKKIIWHVTDAYVDIASVSDKTEWRGTQIVWEFSPEKDSMRIDMTHVGLTPEVECFTICEKGWDFYIKESLYKLLTEGKGMPDTSQAARPLVLERTYAAPVAAVWGALTDSAQMKQWYIDWIGFKPEVGCQFSFDAVKNGTTYVHLCQVKEVIQNKKISYSWRYEGHEGDSLVSFELFDEGDKTRLKLTHEGLHTFTVFKRENFQAGWNHFVNTALPDFLSKK